jgi:hypothetical protein
LLLQSIIRIGGAIDNELNLTQWKEQAISFIHTPFQFLPSLVTAAAKRGSQRAAMGLKDFNRGLREIDYNVTKAGTKRLTPEEQSYINVARCGRGYDKIKLSNIDDTVGTACDYCGHDLCDFDHITWRCPHFAPQRAEACKAIADLDPDALHPSIRRGIAPALAAIPNATFWGQTKVNGENFTDAQAAALKIYEELPQPIPPKTRPPRTDDCLTDEEQTLLKNLSNNFTLNARQVLENIKRALRDLT